MGSRFNPDSFIGREYETNSSGKCFVIDAKSSVDMTVMFYDGFCIKVYKGNLDKGKVYNPFYIDNRRFGVGIYDVGRVKSNPVSLKIRNMWHNMLERCYCEKFHKLQPTYKDVDVCERWKVFSNFEQDVLSMNNFDKAMSHKWSLDKDAIKIGNKVYSKQTCCFLPQEINSKLSTIQNLSSDEYGVTKLPHGAYRVVVGGYGKFGHVGCYETREKASEVYKEVKGRLILESMYKHKCSIDKGAYDSVTAYVLKHVPALANKLVRVV